MNFILLDYRYSTEKKQMFFLPSKNFSLMNKKPKPKISNNGTSYPSLSDEPQSDPQDMIQARPDPQDMIQARPNFQILSNSNVIGPRNNQVRVPLRDSVGNIEEEEKLQGGGSLDSSSSFEGKPDVSEIDILLQQLTGSGNFPPSYVAKFHNFH